MPQQQSGTIFGAGPTCAGNNCVSLVLDTPVQEVVVALAGTFVASVAVEQSTDQGSTWTLVASLTAPGSTTYSVAVAPGQPNVTNFRARCASFTSGPIQATLTVPSPTAPVTVTGPVEIANFPPVQPVSGAIDVGNFPALQTVAGTVIAIGPQGSGGRTLTNPVLVAGLDLTGTTRSVQTDYYGTLATQFSGYSADAFGRGRISTPETLFNVSFQYDLQPLIMQAALTGTGAVTKTTNVTGATVSTGGTANAAGADFQSHGYYRYEPGKSLAITMTGVIGPAVANVRSQIGFFDANDGVFFDQKNGMNVTLRTSTSGSPVDTSVPQASWNLDPMNGTGPSGITLDFTKTQIFFIDLQWLGTGRVRFGFEINGILTYVHQVLNANVIALPYMNTAVLPVHWAIHNTGVAAGTNTMLAVCASVVSEGGNDKPQLYQFVTASPIAGISCSTTPRTPLVSIRPRTTFNSVTNRTTIKITNLSLCDQSVNALYWELIYNGTLTGASFADVNTTYSAVQGDSSATAISGGIIIASGYVQGGSKAELQVDLSHLRIPITLDAAGTVQDIMTLCGTALSATVSANGAINWSEER